MKRMLAIVLALILLTAVSSQAFAVEEGAHLVFTYWGSTVEKETIENAMKQFEAAYPGVTVEPLHIPNDYDTKMVTMEAAGEAPDVCYMSVTMAFTWGKEGKLVNIYDKLAVDEAMSVEDFMDGVWFEWEPGKTFGALPAIEPFGVFYSKDAFDAAGLEYPKAGWTWDEFIATARKLTIDANGKTAEEEGFDPENIAQFGVQFGTGSADYLSFVYSNGGDYITKEGEFVLNQPEAVEALQNIADVINVEHLAPSPIQAKAIPSPVISLQTGKVAMLVGGQWNCLDLGNAEINFDLAPIPVYKKIGCIVQGGTVVMSAESKYPEAAWELWKWMYNPEAVLDLHATGLWMPAMKAWFTDEELLNKWAIGNKYHPEGFKQTFIDPLLEDATSYTSMYVENFGAIDALVGPALDPVWLGEQDAQSALDGIYEAAVAEMNNK